MHNSSNNGFRSNFQGRYAIGLDQVISFRTSSYTGLDRQRLILDPNRFAQRPNLVRLAIAQMQRFLFQGVDLSPCALENNRISHGRMNKHLHRPLLLIFEFPVTGGYVGHWNCFFEREKYGVRIKKKCQMSTAVLYYFIDIGCLVRFNVLWVGIKQKFQHTFLRFPTSEIASLCPEYNSPSNISKSPCRSTQKIYMPFCNTAFLQR